MKPRRFADLTALVRAACTHAAGIDRGIPLVAFHAGGHALGWLRPSFAEELLRWPHWFAVDDAGVTLRTQPDDPATRTAALDTVARALAADGVIGGWREEWVSVAPHYAGPELLRIERAATRPFGLLAYGAHLNGLTRRGGELHFWIARRAATKSVDPDRLDNLVGGRVSSGRTVDETIRKEAWEEAGLPAAMLDGMPCASVVRVEYAVPEGLHREVLFAHDLWIPEDFRPQNQDGEVARLYCLSVVETLEALLAGEFTLDAAAVTVDAFLRHGVLEPEDPQYLALARLLVP